MPIKKMTPPKKNVFLDIDTAYSKGLIIVCMAAALLIIFGLAFNRVKIEDPRPELTHITSITIRELGAFTVKVEAGMFIKNFPSFDVAKNKFIIDSVVWFEYNADEVMPETIDHFTIDRGSILSKSPADIRITGNRIFAKYNVIFSVSCDLYYRRFPFNDHRLVILLANNNVTPEEMYYTTDKTAFQIAPNIFPTDWTLFGLDVDAGYQELKLDPQDASKKIQNPKALFIINIVKASTRKLLLIFLPIFSAVFFSLFSFTLNIANVVGKTSLALSAVTALLGYRFVLEQMIPNVGYFTTTDEVYLFLLIMAFIIFIFQLFITRKFMVRSEEEKKALKGKLDPLEITNRNGFLLLSLLFITTCAYLLLK